MTLKCAINFADFLLNYSDIDDIDLIESKKVLITREFFDLYLKNNKELPQNESIFSTDLIKYKGLTYKKYNYLITEENKGIFIQ